MEWKYEEKVEMPRTKHHVVIEFDLNVAPELADRIKEAIGREMYSMLGYPTNALGRYVYSFNQPELPKTISVVIRENVVES